MDRIASNEPLNEVYQHAIESLGIAGSEYKNDRGKLRRAIQKAFKLGCQPAAFIWLDHKGIKHLPQQMATPHLFYALRMIWNHSVPEYYKIPGVRKYSDVPHWSFDYRREALRVLGDELDSRPTCDLDEWQHKQLRYMQIATKLINAQRA